MIGGSGRQTTGVVYDLGYVPHDGPRLGRKGAISATVREGVRRVLGLRRSARRKVFPFLLLAFAIIPAAVFVGLAFLLSDLQAADVEAFGHANYFNITAWLTLLFTAFAGAELLVPDRVEGVLSVYASRPLRSADYLLARGSALGIVVTAFLLVPQLFLYVGLAAVSDDGLVSGLVDGIDELWRIPLAALVFFAASAAPAFLIGAYARRTSTAAGLYLALMIGSIPVSLGLVEASGIPGNRYAGLLALEHHARYVRDWIFDTSTGTWVPEQAGLGEIWSLGAIVVLVALSWFVARRRYRSEL